jgi:hypothetical protein
MSRHLGGERNQCGMDCGGDMIPVDEMMLPIILTIREKGYDTNACCSGHPMESCVLDKRHHMKGDEIKSGYIQFGKKAPVCDHSLAYWIYRIDPITNLEGLSMEGWHDGMEMTPLKRHKAILKRLLRLSEWVDELEPYKEKTNEEDTTDTNGDC